MEFVSHIVCYAKSCFKYQDFVEGSCLPVNYCPRAIIEQSLCRQLKLSMRDTVTSLIPTMWSFLNLFSIRWQQPKHSKDFKYLTFISSDSFHIYIDIYMAGIIIGRGDAYFSRALITPLFWGSCIEKITRKTDVCF